MTVCVANTWQHSRSGPSAISNQERVYAGHPNNANNVQQLPLSVSRFPWYY